MEIFNNLQTKSVNKGTILLRHGEHGNVVFKVLKGCLRSYVIDKSGKEHILQFAPEDWLISDMDGMVNNKPSVIFIDAIEDSEVMLLTRSTFENIAELDQAFLVEQNIKLMRNLITANKRLIALMSASSEDRYTEFVETYPTLIQRIPLKFIASYLGMTPEYLSEVRRKLTKK
ncbi:MAG TPA: Crp/Fnr family transcriptional regulator [Crocinitomicaceae bacterium]|nr:Crp/Fnr family transcriptional regulator [Crocinitomicaceae bacterium]